MSFQNMGYLPGAVRLPTYNYSLIVPAIGTLFTSPYGAYHCFHSATCCCFLRLPASRKQLRSQAFYLLPRLLPRLLLLCSCRCSCPLLLDTASLPSPHSFAGINEPGTSGQTRRDTAPDTVFVCFVVLVTTLLQVFSPKSSGITKDDPITMTSVVYRVEGIYRVRDGGDWRKLNERVRKDGLLPVFCPSLK